MNAARDRIGISFLERLPLAGSRRWLSYGFAALASILATALRFEVDHLLPPGFPFLTFFPAVILTAFLFGIGPGLLAALLCGAAAWYWFIPPLGFSLAYSSAVALAFYVGIVIVDILLVHWMQRANAHFAEERRRADALAETRETLFRELQHRVGNNLQMVASLLSLQSRNVPPGEALTALTEASRRVALVGRIQRTLYSSEGEQLALAPYIEAIARDTLEASGRSDIAFRFSADVGDAQLAPNAAIPAALAVAEAVSNAVEHAYAGRGGTLDVAVVRDEKHYILTVEDDGAGLPEGFDAASSTSLGLRIARNLSNALGGEFRLLPRPDVRGTRAVLRIAATTAN